MTTPRPQPVVMVTGARTVTDRDFVYRSLDEAVRDLGKVTLRHGAAKGADELSAQWAVDRGHDVDPMPADWEKLGKQAGFIRNQAMVDKYPRPRLVVAFVDFCRKEHCWPSPHPSHGTAHAMSVAELTRIPVARYFLESPK